MANYERTVGHSWGGFRQILACLQETVAGHGSDTDAMKVKQFKRLNVLYIYMLDSCLFTSAYVISGINYLWLLGYFFLCIFYFILFYYLFGLCIF